MIDFPILGAEAVCSVQNHLKRLETLYCPGQPSKEEVLAISALCDSMISELAIVKVCARDALESEGF